MAAIFPRARFLLLSIYVSVFIWQMPLPNAFSDQIVNNEDPSLVVFNEMLSEGISLPGTDGVINIEVPPGRKNIQPNLSVVYLGGSQGTLIGTGWTINFDCIVRSTKRGAPKYDSSDKFLLLQGGSNQDLVYDSSAGFYRLKIEGMFSKIEFLSTYWVITDKQGTKYYFGASNDARQSDPAIPGNIYKWFLNKVEDVHGNYMTLSYSNDSSQIYLQKIDWTGNSNNSSQPYASVELLWETRNIPYTNYSSGFLVKTNKRLAKVDVKVNNLIQRDYRFTYIQSTATTRDLLYTIQQFGNDGHLSLPKMQFEYYGAEKGFQANSASIPSAVQFSQAVSGGNIDLGVRIIDVNSDAYPDIIKYMKSSTGEITKGVYINNKNNSWALDQSFVLPEKGSASLASSIITAKPIPHYQYNYIIHNIDAGLRFADINADGRFDLVCSLYYLNVANYYASVETLEGSFLNNQAGWGQDDAVWRLPSSANMMYWFTFVNSEPLRISWRYQFLGNMFCDVNDDGYIDIVTTRQPPPSGQYYTGGGIPPISRATFMNNIRSGATGWSQDAKWTVPDTTYTDLSDGADLIDLNSDGLPDIFYAKAGVFKVSMNTGNGWIEDSSSGWANTFGLGDLTDGSTQFGDINGDGLTDLIIAKGGYSNGSRVLINTGNGWFQDDGWILSDGNFTNLGSRILDANADGLLDFMIHYNGETPLLYLNKGKISDLLKTINNGLGGITLFEYGTSAQYSNTFLPSPLPVTTSVTKSNNINASYKTSFSYAKGLWDAGEREFRGFGFVKTIDPEGNWTETEYLQDAIFKSRIKEQRFYNSNGQILSKTISTWNSHEICPSVNFVFMRRQDSLMYGQDGSSKRSAEEYFYEESPQYGNLTKAIQWGEVDSSTGSDIGNDKRSTETVYHNNTENGLWLIGFPQMSVSKNAGDVYMRKGWFSYDGKENNIKPVKGLLTKNEKWGGDQSGALPAITRFTYDVYGDVTAVTDPSGNTVSTIYDSGYGIFSLVVNNSMGHTLTREYFGINGVPLDNGNGLKGLWGQLKSITDPNNQMEQKSYDILGRLVMSISPLDSIQFPTMLLEYVINPTYSIVVTRNRIQQGKAETLDTYKFIDGFGRVMQVKTPSPNPDKCIVREAVRYNHLNAPQEIYQPFFSTNSVSFLETPLSAQPHDSLTYDGLGRLIKKINPNGTYITIGYNKWTEIVIDENGHKQELDRDAFGRLAQNRTYKGADGRYSSIYPQADYALYGTTNYEYDSEGDLLKVIDAKGNILSANYNTFGQRTMLNDPDMGILNYEYDLNGNLVKQTDAKAQVVQMTYDSLNRLTSRKDQASLDIQYTYDSPGISFSKGRLTKAVYGQNDRREMQYDALGREIQTRKLIDGISYDINLSYDTLDRFIMMKYPDNTEVKYNYNLAGEIDNISVRYQPVIPPAPVLNSALAGDKTVNLIWTNVSGAAEYKVKYGTSSNNYTVTINAGNVTSYQAANLTNGTTYYFVVTALNSAGESVNSNEKSAMPQGVPLTPVLNSAIAGDKSVTLNWGSASGAAGYKVKYGISAGNYTSTVNAGNVTNYQVSNLTNGTAYYFVVTALNSAGDSPDSNEKSAVPQAPLSGQIIIDNTSTKQIDSVSSVAYNHTISTSGNNRVLVVSLSLKDTTIYPGASSVKYAGQPLKMIRKVNIFSSGKLITVELWYLLNPPTGNNSVEAVFNTNVNGVAAGAVSLINVKQQAPESSTGTFSTSAAISKTITTKTNGALVIGAISVIESSSLQVTDGSGQTQRYFERNSGDIIGVGSTKSSPIAGNVNMSWSLSQSSAWALAMASFAPAQPLAGSIIKKYIRICIEKLFDTACELFKVEDAYAETTFDFTTFTENDPDNKITKTNNKISYSDIETCVSNSYVYKNYTSGNSFSYLFDSVLTSTNSFAGPVLIWGIANNPNKTFDDWSDGVRLVFNKIGSTVRMELGGPGIASQLSSSLVLGQRYYVTAVRSANTITAKIYSDANRNTLINSLSVTETTQSFLYLYAFSTRSFTGTNKRASGDISNLVDAFAQPPTPPAPILNSAIAGDKTVTLNWGSVSGAIGYRVKYGTSAGNYTNTINAGNVTNYQATNLINGTAYYFVVTASNDAGDSANSNEKSAVPEAPPAPPSAPVLNNAAAGDKSVNLNWGNVNNAIEYKIRYGTSSGSYDTVINAGNVISYSVTGLYNGLTYYFVIAASNSAGDSQNSNELSAMPQALPSAPLLNSAPAGDKSVTLVWESVTGAAGYKVKYGTTSGNYTASINTGNVTNYQVTGLTNGTVYYFVITAVNSIGDSPDSNELSSKPYVVVEANIVTKVEYNPALMPTKIEYGNGVITNYTYDENTLRLKRIQTIDSQGVYIQDLSYTYDGAGNVISISDAINTASQSFKYDELNRLMQADGSGYGAKNFAFNEIGGITQKEGLSYGYGNGEASGPHAVISIGTGIGLTYDANGNLKQKNQGGVTTEYTYDSQNQLVKVTKDSIVTSNYAYDSEGERTKKTTNGITTRYFGDLYEETSTGSQISYIFFGGQRIAGIVNGQPYFYHSDHLGSMNVVTGIDGSKKEIAEYLPYGNTSFQYKADPNQRLTGYYFTDQYYDGETGLYYYGARYYSPDIGRFITADSIISDIDDSQELDPYGYVCNNPLNYIDPTGNERDSIGPIDLERIVVTINPPRHNSPNGSAIGMFTSSIVSGVGKTVSVAKDFFVDTETFSGGYNLLTTADYSTGRGWLEGSVGFIGMAAVSADAGMNFVSGGAKSVATKAVKQMKKVVVVGESVGTDRVMKKALEIGAEYYNPRKAVRDIGLKKAIRNNWQYLRTRFKRDYRKIDIGLHPDPKKAGKGLFYSFEQKWIKMWRWD